MIDNHRLEAALETYLRTWGPLQWREDLLEPVADIGWVGQTFAALSMIEVDSMTMYRKIRTAGLDHDPRIRAFLFPWLAEEAEHGRALNALAVRYESPVVIRDRHDRRPTLRNSISWPSLAVLRPGWRQMQASYCVLGMVQEYVALITYKWLSNLVSGYAGACLLKAIARQEGRHMRFYREAAEVFLTIPGATSIARQGLKHLWNPVGIDAIGADTWWEAFGRLMVDEEFQRDFQEVDRILDCLPGMESLEIAGNFLVKNSGRLQAQSSKDARYSHPKAL